MADQKISTIIVSKPGPLPDGLRVLLSTLPRIHLVGVVDDLAEVVNLLKTKRQALILLDNSLEQDDEGKALHAIKSALPNAVCMVIVGDVEHRNIALKAGADWAELTGFPASALYSEIEKLLTARF